MATETAPRQGSTEGDTEPIDLDVLRGWRERHDPELVAEHALPVLARLVLDADDGTTRTVFEVRGPEVYIGRYHPQHGPIDLILTELLDHEIYKLSAPHARLTLEDHGGWTMRPMSPAAVTAIGDVTLDDTRKQHPIADGEVATLGCIPLRFETTDVTFDAWREARKELLLSVDCPALFLCRSGAVCGPYIELDSEGTVVGRSFPRPEELPSKSWTEPQADWNLAGLREHERKFVGFRHARFTVDDEGEWIVDPITSRQRTYVNRVEISSATPLMPGDEVAMGSVLFHFHDPKDVRASTESRTAELPTVVNWQEEHTSPEIEPVDRDSADADEGEDG